MVLPASFFVAIVLVPIFRFLKDDFPKLYWIGISFVIAIILCAVGWTLYKISAHHAF